MKNTAAALLLEHTIKQIESLRFHLEHKTASRHFTRKSVLGFRNTALIILNMVKKSIRVEVMNYFNKFDNEIEKPSRQAFSEARDKISFLAFKDFFDKSCEIAVTSDGARTYKGYRLFAVDGTSFVVGELKRLKEYFGESTTVPNKAMCRISGVIDVMNECIVNAKVSAFGTGERALAISQVKELKDVSNALFLFDRGYWSPELVKGIIGNGQKFLMRLASNTEKAIVKNGYGTIKDADVNEHKLRCYSFILPSGERETLLTNITESEMTDDELAVLYIKRWSVETKYLELKDRLQIDKFSGCSVNTVLQDIYSTLYMSNLSAFICFEADEAIKERTDGKNNKYGQKANRSTCINALRNQFIEICLLRDPVKRGEAFRRLYNDISKDVVYVNKSKARPRNKRQLKESRLHRFKAVL